MPSGVYIRTKPGWSKDLTKETDERIKKKSEDAGKTLIKKYASGEITVWCDGLTKETDERVKKAGEKQSKTRKEMFASGDIKIWCDGLTSETDERVKAYGEKISETLSNQDCSIKVYKAWETKRKNGTDIAWHAGLTKETDERVKKKGEDLSKIRIEKFSKGELKIWCDGLTKETSPILAEIARKNRIFRTNQIIELGYWAQPGRHEKQILDEIEQKERIIIDRKFSVHGYLPDGYCHETNTIYEIYEKWHENEVEHDAYRQKEIEEELNCKFVIIWDK